MGGDHHCFAFKYHDTRRQYYACVVCHTVSVIHHPCIIRTSSILTGYCSPAELQAYTGTTLHSLEKIEHFAAIIWQNAQDVVNGFTIVVKPFLQSTENTHLHFVHGWACVNCKS